MRLKYFDNPTKKLLNNNCCGISYDPGYCYLECDHYFKFCIKSFPGLDYGCNKNYLKTDVLTQKKITFLIGDRLNKEINNPWVTTYKPAYVG